MRFLATNSPTAKSADDLVIVAVQSGGSTIEIAMQPRDAITLTHEVMDAAKETIAERQKASAQVVQLRRA